MKKSLKIVIIISISVILLGLIFTLKNLKSSKNDQIGNRTLVWADEFDQDGVPNVKNWKYQTVPFMPGWGNNELQIYTDNSEVPDTASVQDGFLRIKAYKKDGEWYSARMNSKKAWKYGYIEARMKITDTKGCWPAFWMMPLDSVYGGWPKGGEIDIMENAPAVCGDHAVFSSLHAQGHYGSNPAPLGWKDFGENLKNEWHVIALDWTENEIKSYYDGQLMGSYKNDGNGFENWPYDSEFYLIMNLAIGGNLGGTSFVDSIPNQEAEFLIDYVRVYQ